MAHPTYLNARFCDELDTLSHENVTTELPNECRCPFHSRGASTFEGVLTFCLTASGTKSEFGSSNVIVGGDTSLNVYRILTGSGSKREAEGAYLEGNAEGKRGIEGWCGAVGG